MTSERSRTIIRTHHTLQKEHAAAVKRGDTVIAAEFERAIEKNGGIKLYQAASKQGQAKERGGDSSKLLVEWLHQSGIINADAGGTSRAISGPLRCLEVGALSTNNEISRLSSAVHMTRIDLNSQGPGIEKQDFMARPLPLDDDNRFDIISLSLVLNYVPDAVGRGEMLKRVTKFMRVSQTSDVDSTATFLPCFFFVLPLPCTENSRYFDEALLLHIMDDLGFIKFYSKNTTKLCYYLLRWSGKVGKAKTEKRKIRDGPGMNNFCVVVE